MSEGTQVAKNGIPRQAEIFAGRPISYWKKLTERKELQPMPKPAPVAKQFTERLPKEQLDGITSNLRYRTGVEAQIALDTFNTIEKEILKLHEEDAKEILKAAFTVSDSNVAERVVKFIPNFSASIQYELIDFAMNGTFAALHACDMIGNIPEEHETYKIQLIEKALKNRYRDLAVKAVGQIRSCSDKTRSELIRVAFKSPDSTAAIEAVSLVAAVPKEKRIELLKEAIEIGHAFATVQHLERLDEEERTGIIAFALDLKIYGGVAAVIPLIPNLPKEKQPQLIEKAMQSNNDQLCLDLCKLIPDFPEEKVEGMLTAALKNTAPATGSKAIEIFTSLTPKKQTKNLWNEAIERVKRDLAQNRYDTYLKISAQPEIVPEEHRKTLMLEGFNSLKKYGQHLFPDVIKLIPHLKAEEQPELWKNAVEITPTVLKSRNDKIKDDLIQTIPLFPAQHRAQMIRIIAADTAPIHQLKVLKMIWQVPAEERKELWETASKKVNECLSYHTDDVRATAVATVPILQAEYIPPLMENIINSTLKEVWSKSCEAIAASPKELQPQLIKQAFHSNYKDVRLKAFNELVPTQPLEQQITLVKEALKSEYGDITVAAVERLASFPKEKQLELINCALSSPIQDVRIKAVRLTESLPAEIKKLVQYSVVGEIFENTLDYSNATLSMQALELLKLAPSTVTTDKMWKKAAKKIKKALKSEQYAARAIAIENLPRLPEKPQRKLLKHAINSEYGDVRLKAFELLITGVYYNRGDALEMALKSDYQDVQLKAIAGISAAYYRDDLWKIASKKMNDAFDSRDNTINTKAFELLPLFPPEYQQKILKEAFDGYSCFNAMRLIPSRSESEQPELWKAAATSMRLACASAATWPDAVKIIKIFPAEMQPELWKIAFAEAKGKIKSEYYSWAAVNVIHLFPKEYHPYLIKYALKSNSESVRLHAASLIPNLEAEYKALGRWRLMPNFLAADVHSKDTLLTTATKTIIEGVNSSDKDDAVKAAMLFPHIAKEKQTDELWKIAAEKIKPAFGSSDFTIGKTAAREIAAFPADYQPQLIRTALDGQWWGPVLDAVALLGQISQGNDELWETASKKIEIALASDHKETYTRAAGLITTLPEKYQPQLFKTAFDSSHEEVRQKAVELLPFVSIGEQTKVFHSVFESKSEDVHRKTVALIETLQPAEQLLPIQEAFNSPHVDVYLKVIPFIAKLPNEPKIYADWKELLWEKGVEKTTACLILKNVTSSSEAAKLIPSFPAEQQAKLIRAALDAQYWDATLDAIGMITALPQQHQTEELWEAAAKELESKDALTTDTMDTRLKTVELLPKFPKKQQLRLFKKAFESKQQDTRKKAVEKIAAVDAEQQLELLKIALNSEHYEVRLNAMEFSLGSRELKVLFEGPALFATVAKERQTPEIWKKAAEAMEYWIGTGSAVFAMRAVQTISYFPVEMRPKLIATALASGYWIVTIDSIRDLVSLPKKYQTAELLNSALKQLEQVFDTDHGTMIIEGAMHLLEMAKERPELLKISFKHPQAYGLILAMMQNDPAERQFDFLKLVLESADKEQCITALKYLKKLPQDKVLELFKTLFQAPNKSMRLKAVEALPGLPDEQQRELLKIIFDKGLSDPDMTIKACDVMEGLIERDAKRGPKT